MSIVKVELHRQASAADHQDAYFLARDTARSRLFVEHDWVRREDGVYEEGVDEIEIDAFLTEAGPAQRRLQMLLGRQGARQRGPVNA